MTEVMCHDKTYVPVLTSWTGGPIWSRSRVPGSIDDVSDYRFSQALLVRLLGTVLVGLGLLVAVVVALAAVLDLPSAVVTVTVVLAVVLVLGAGLFLTRLSSLVHFDDAGYRVRWLRGAGVQQARWKDVEDVVTAVVAGHDCVVLRLRDGRTTTIPVRVLDASPADFVADLRAHLDKGHGYRRLNRPRR